VNLYVCNKCNLLLLEILRETKLIEEGSHLLDIDDEDMEYETWNDNDMIINREVLRVRCPECGEEVQATFHVTLKQCKAIHKVIEERSDTGWILHFEKDKDILTEIML